MKEQSNEAVCYDDPAGGRECGGERTGGAQKTKRGGYRWWVLLIIFWTYALDIANRINIGVLLPVLKEEYHITNLESGALASFFFIGYVLPQIPAGYWYSRYGIRRLITLAILGFSGFTYLLGTAASTAQIKWYRFGLGIAQSPVGIGVAAEINNWFPPKEKGMAVGVFGAATMFPPIIVPPLCAWIMTSYSWQYVFYWFAVPGILVAAVWYILVADTPRECPYCSPREADYIEDHEVGKNGEKSPARQFGWLDRLIRARQVPCLATRSAVFTSWNIWGNTLAFFCMISVFYGLLTWIPSYLVNEKHYTFVRMGFVAAAPWIGAVIGSLLGGWVSDHLLDKRRKPTMLLTAVSTAVMMVVLINAPENIALVAAVLVLTGFALNIGWPHFTSYPMGLTTGTTYPVAYGLTNSVANFGGFVSPLIAGWLLDSFASYVAVFAYFGLCMVAAFVLLLTIEEPL